MHACIALKASRHFQRIIEGQQLKGKIVSALFFVLLHTKFDTFSDFSPRTSLKIMALKKTKPFFALVVPRLSSNIYPTIWPQ